MKEAAAGELVQSLVRGLAVIRAFDGEHPRLRLSDVAARAGLPRAAARRFLLTLVAEGYVDRDEREFWLTPRVLDLGFRYLASSSLPELVQPHLERLSRDVDESVSAAVLDGADVVYVARVPTRRIMSVRITIGTRFPAHATSMGRVLLASLPEPGLRALLEASDLRARAPGAVADVEALLAEVARVRQQGWALVDGELEPGLRSVAAPVHARDGSVLAAINVSTSASRDDLERLEAVHLPAVRSAAAAIDAELRLR